MKKTAFIFLMATCLAEGIQAQTLPTLENAVYGGLIPVKGGGGVNWLEDGLHYSQAEKNPAGGRDIVSYSAKDLSKEVLLSLIHI